MGRCNRQATAATAQMLMGTDDGEDKRWRGQAMARTSDGECGVGEGARWGGR